MDSVIPYLLENLEIKEIKGGRLPPGAFESVAPDKNMVLRKAEQRIAREVVDDILEDGNANLDENPALKTFLPQALSALGYQSGNLAADLNKFIRDHSRTASLLDANAANLQPAHVAAVYMALKSDDANGMSQFDKHPELKDLWEEAKKGSNVNKELLEATDRLTSPFRGASGHTPSPPGAPKPNVPGVPNIPQPSTSRRSTGSAAPGAGASVDVLSGVKELTNAQIKISTTDLSKLTATNIELLEAVSDGLERLAQGNPEFAVEAGDFGGIVNAMNKAIKAESAFTAPLKSIHDLDAVRLGKFVDYLSKNGAFDASAWDDVLEAAQKKADLGLDPENRLASAPTASPFQPS
jgi:hypothetical protein